MDTIGILVTLSALLLSTSGPRGPAWTPANNIEGLLRIVVLHLYHASHCNYGVLSVEPKSTSIESRYRREYIQFHSFVEEVDTMETEAGSEMRLTRELVLTAGLHASRRILVVLDCRYHAAKRRQSKHTKQVQSNLQGSWSLAGRDLLLRRPSSTRPRKGVRSDTHAGQISKLSMAIAGITGGEKCRWKPASALAVMDFRPEAQQRSSMPAYRAS
jgi:hypothetical protein